MAQNVHDVATAVLDRTGPTDTYKLQKLLYYAQAWHLAVTGEPLFDDDVLGWADGPVVEEVYQRHRGRRMVASWTGDEHNLTATAAGIIDLVHDTYGGLSGQQLSTLTHNEDPWIESRAGLAEGASGKRPLSHQTMATYYRNHGTLGGQTAEDLASRGVTTWLPAWRLTDRQLEQLDTELAAIAEEARSNPGDAPLGSVYGRVGNRPVRQPRRRSSARGVR